MRPHLKTPEVTSDFVNKHYLRFVVKDRPGIIASLATILAHHGVNIDSVRQKPRSPKAHLPSPDYLGRMPYFARRSGVKADRCARFHGATLSAPADLVRQVSGFRCQEKKVEAFYASASKNCAILRNF